MVGVGAYFGLDDKSGAHFAGLLTTLAGLLVWKTQNRLPKTSANKIGVVVAIVASDTAEAKTIRGDFLTELRRLLESDEAAAKFEMIIPTGYWAEEAARNFERAGEVLLKARGQMIFFGSARLRPFNGQPTHFLSLAASVRHAPVTADTSKALSRDMGEVLPQRVQFAVDGDALSFDATSQWIKMGAKFLAAVAMGFEGNYAYAESLLLGVERELATGGKTAPFLQPLSRKVPLHLLLIYRAWLTFVGDKYYIRRDRNSLPESDAICDKIIARDPTFNAAYLHKAIAAFVLRRDIQAARELVKKSDRGDDTIQHYSYAFLHAYEGDLKKAHDEYREAFKRPSVNPNAPIQSEEFIQIVMDEEPDKAYLVFCTALINYNAKEDFEAAERDFTRFLALPATENMTWARQKAKDLLTRCPEKKRHQPREMPEVPIQRIA